jgi:hypothetical protein
MSGESFLTVAQSSNGSTWNTLGTYGTCSGCTAITDCADITHTLSPTSRYIRWLYTKATGNVGLDDVSITSCGTAPSNQVTAINITNASPTSQNLVLTRGNGARVIVLARAGGAVNSDPVDGTSYTANSVFGSGSQIGTGNYVVYDGTGTSFTVTGQTNGQNYYYAAYEFSSAACPVYKIPAFTANKLPVELISFQGAAQNKAALLSFSTATEINNAYFSIERSADGARYEAIGQVPGAGTSTVINNYTYTDEQPLPGVNYYRLRQVDFDGQFAYSPVVSVVFGSTDARLLIAPSPASDDVTVQLTQPTAEPISWEVYDQGGRMVLQGTAASEVEQFGFNVGALAEGFYILRVSNGREVMVERFQKR